MPGPVVSKVLKQGVLGLQAVHGERDSVGGGGAEEEVDVIGHQAVSENLDTVLLAMTDEQVEVTEAVAGGKEDVLAVVAASPDTGREVSGSESGLPGRRCNIFCVNCSRVA